ncbi:putative ribonuclease H-like domain-containing protein [Tanacetum coccineum]
MLVQGLIFQGEGSTVPVESYHIPTDAPSTSPPHISPTLRSPIRQETKVPYLSSPPHTNVADEAASIGVDVRHGRAVTSLDAGQGSGNINNTSSMPHDSLLPRGHTLRSDEGRMQQNELMDLVTKLSDRCKALETDLRQIKQVYSAAFTKLIKKVKQLEKTVNTSQARRRAKIMVSDDEEDLEDSSKKGRMIEEINQEAGVTLVTPTHSQEDQPEDQLGVFSAAKVLADVAKENVPTYIRRRRAVSTGSGGISTASRLFSTAEELVSTTSASMPVSTAGMVQEVNISISSPVVVKDKGKAAVRLQEELDEEERQRMARVHEATQSLVEMIAKRKKFFAA